MVSKLSLFIFWGLYITVCAGEPAGRPVIPTESAEKLIIYVSILPQAFFVERIGGEQVNVNVLVGPGQAPETYEPTPRQMAGLGKAHAYFRIGTPFEESVIDKIAGINKNLEIIDTRMGVTFRHFKDSHSSRTADPHIWLSPEAVKVQAATICTALGRLSPDRRAFFEKNLTDLTAELEKTHQKIVAILGPHKGEKFYVFHPAFGYFGDTYGLEQIAIESEGHEPSPRQLADLIKSARERGVKVIFIQPQHDKNNAETIAREIGAIVVPMDPLARDYLDNLLFMAESVRSAFERQ
ncbi:zinc ABC transporter substrate-binding protein [candidate division KSB1 bacterium]|nr:zinc ABC transporter substrate-binding protein [candidate division KSB1 bacterium]